MGERSSRSATLTDGEPARSGPRTSTSTAAIFTLILSFVEPMADSLFQKHSSPNALQYIKMSETLIA